MIKMDAAETMQTKITQEINSIAQQIVENYHPIKIILFGSAARGDYEEANDLDFLIWLIRSSSRSDGDNPRRFLLV
jgi:predicted nucleotidyltransferase